MSWIICNSKKGEIPCVKLFHIQNIVAIILLLFLFWPQCLCTIVLPFSLTCVIILQEAQGSWDWRTESTSWKWEMEDKRSSNVQAGKATEALMFLCYTLSWNFELCGLLDWKESLSVKCPKQQIWTVELFEVFYMHIMAFQVKIVGSVLIGIPHYWSFIGDILAFC